MILRFANLIGIKSLSHYSSIPLCQASNFHRTKTDDRLLMTDQTILGYICICSHGSLPVHSFSGLLVVLFLSAMYFFSRCGAQCPNLKSCGNTNQANISGSAGVCGESSAHRGRRIDPVLTASLLFSRVQIFLECCWVPELTRPPSNR